MKAFPSNSLALYSEANSDTDIKETIVSVATAVMVTKLTLRKTVLRNTTLTLDLTLDFATITIDLAREQDVENALAHGNKIWFQKASRLGICGRQCRILN